MSTSTVKKSNNKKQVKSNRKASHNLRKLRKNRHNVWVSN